MAPHFINITDSKSLDQSSRTEVRVQVMKDYHRRRKGAGSAKEGNETSHVPAPISAKAMSGKFRFGQERVLRPWKPVKALRGKGKGRALPASAVGRKPRNPTFKPQVLQQPNEIEGESAANVGWLDDSVQIDPAAMPSTHGELQLDPSPDQDPVDQWLANLDFALQTSILYHSPGTGALDPFAAMSVLITPRTQLLLHHYCKCLVYLFSLNYIHAFPVYTSP
jgi:hypothetical protein